MNYQKWQDWRLSALNEKQEKNEDVEVLDESFYRLNSEARLGVSLRSIKKYLSEIEKQYNKAVQSGKVDEAVVERWSKAYKTLKELDERLHGLMNAMYKEDYSRSVQFTGRGPNKLVYEKEKK